MNSIRLLLVEPDFEEATFLQQALDEIQENARHGEWISFDTIHVESLDDARAVVAAQPPDLVLLNPSLPGTTPLASVTALLSAGSAVPLVVIVGRGDETLARRLLREGAQDFLVREEIDCGPLFRAIRNAIDRQRYLNACRSGTAFDELTGFLNERGFYTAATRDLHLAAGAGQPLTLVLADIDNLTDITLAYGQEQRDLTLLDSAEVLREAGGPGALLACLGKKRFAALVWNMRPEELIGRVQTRLSLQPRPFAFLFGWAVTHPGAMESIDPLLSAAEACLCENGQSYQFPTDPSLSTLHTALEITSRV
jgi:GGDEF domain-containing protein